MDLDRARLLLVLVLVTGLGESVGNAAAADSPEWTPPPVVVILLLFSDAAIVVGFCKDIDGIVIFVGTIDIDPCPCVADSPVDPAVDIIEVPPATVDPVPPFPPFTASSER